MDNDQKMPPESGRAVADRELNTDGDSALCDNSNNDFNKMQRQLVGIPSKKTVDRTDQYIIRIIGQYLEAIGLDQTAEFLMEESSCQVDHPSAVKFRQHVIDGDWKKADQDFDELKSIVKNSDQNLLEMRFLLLEQQYLELLDNGLVMDALQLLQNKITPLGYNTNRVHLLCEFMMCSGQDQLQTVAKWDGKGTVSRALLMDKLQKYLPPSIMLPPNRLESLLCQALEMQKQKCAYHVSNSSATLDSVLVDHNCSQENFPCHAIQKLNDHCDEVWHCKFSPDGLKLATSSKDMTVIIWDVDLETLRVTRRETLKDHSFEVAMIAWCPDSSHIIALGPEDCPEIWLWSIGDPDCELRMKLTRSTDDSLTACAWFFDGSEFVTGGLRGQFYQFDIDGNLLDSWEGVRIKSLYCKNDGKTILAADSHHRIRSYDFDEPDDFTILQEDHPILSFTVNKTERLALLNVANQGVHLWDLQDKCLVRRFQGVTQGQFTIHSCFGGVNDDFVASGSEDSKIYIWNIKYELPIAILVGHNESVNCVAWNPVYPQMMASVSDDCTVLIWGPKSLSPGEI